MSEQAIALNSKAFPIFINMNFSAHFTGNIRRTVDAAAINNQQLIGEFCAGETFSNTARLVQREHGHRQG